MDRLERVAHAALAEELRLAEVWIPARTVDPAAHHETAARQPVNVAWWTAGEEFENFVAYLRGAAFVGVQAKNPVIAARLDGIVAQIIEAFERHLHHTGSERCGNLSTVASVL
jgi:hypothetical protein